MRPERWWALWVALCKRFSREPTQEEAAAYLEYLDALLAPEQIEFAVRAVWAEREFFPRPTDFVMAAHTRVKRQLRLAASAWNSPAGRDGWVQHLGGKGSLASRLLEELGGVTQVHALLMKGPYAFRQEVGHAMADLLRADAAQLPPLLPANETRKFANQLKPPSDRNQ